MVYTIFYSIFYISFFFIISSNCFLVLPFNTIFIKDNSINDNDFHSILIQNEIYVNLSIGTPKQNFISILKMDKYGFIIYENAFNYSLSDSYESVDEDLRISWMYDCDSFPSIDYFYFSYFNSYKDLENFIKNKNANIYNKTRINKIPFLRISEKNGTSNKFNKQYNKYGIIGLKYNSNSYFNAPELVKSLKSIKEIKNYFYTFKFEKNLINNFIDNNNKGYFIIGEDLTDNIQEKEEIKYIYCEEFGGTIEWDIKFDSIYVEFNKEKQTENNLKYKEVKKKAQIFVNYPYLVGSSEYFLYIKENFFNELVEKNICFINNIIKDEDKFYSYKCDSKSKDFFEYLDKFPNLVFENKIFEFNFTFTKYDLFTYNSFNNSDTFLYFLIIKNWDIKYSYYDWVIGIPFLKKYRLSFDYESKRIGFYKNEGKMFEEKQENSKFYQSIYFKIFIITILIFIIFILGMIFQKNLNKNRKKKANELDDDYEYNSYNENKNDDNNNKIGVESIN